MKNIKQGDTVQLLCEAKLENGELCYTNDAQNPIELVVGEGKFFHGGYEGFIILPWRGGPSCR